MSRGIIYCMSTVVEGLIKIGKTGVNKFEERMRFLEKNGYANINGLHRRFAIEVDDYDEKEVLLKDIFEKSNIMGTELFAIDIELVVQLLSSLLFLKICQSHYSRTTSQSRHLLSLSRYLCLDR